MLRSSALLAMMVASFGVCESAAAQDGLPKPGKYSYNAACSQSSAAPSSAFSAATEADCSQEARSSGARSPAPSKASAPASDPGYVECQYTQTSGFVPSMALRA